MINMELEGDFLELIGQLESFPEVEGIMLGGSIARGNGDIESDYDLYVYLNGEIDHEKRKKLMDLYLCEGYDFNMTFWEDGDEGTLKNSRRDVDIMYRDLNWIKDTLENIVKKHQVSMGYSTSLWENFVNSKILFDRNGKLKKLQDQYSISFPDELVQNIIYKNLPLLDGIHSNYIRQIEKAVKRDDYNSVNHRIKEFLASYFDIVFAINKIKHPGEKRILESLDKELEFLPRDLHQDIEEILKNQYKKEYDLIDSLRSLVLKLREKIGQAGFN